MERTNVTGVKTFFSIWFSELKFPIAFRRKKATIAQRANLIIIGRSFDCISPPFIATTAIIIKVITTETVSNNNIWEMSGNFPPHT